MLDLQHKDAVKVNNTTNTGKRQDGQFVVRPGRI